MVDVSAVVLTGLNLGFWVGMLFNLPGTWLMVLVTAVLKWWQPGYVRVSGTVLGVAVGLAVLGVAVGLAVLGEALEFVLGAAGSRQTGAPHGPRRWPLSAASSAESWARHSRCRSWGR
jgi:hypothetical protein